ncbi:MAG TPA: hypothetical protein VF818_06645, partial [Ktedonobacterales bacterium]
MSTSSSDPGSERTEQEAQLAQLLQRATSELERISDSAEIEEWRTRYLGRERGALTAILKSLGKLPDAQRRAVGQAANAVKAELEGKLEQR